jgi:hypothetical protein
MSDSEFNFVSHWQIESAENDAKVVEFWKSEGALATDVKTEERLRQVIVRAETSDGEIAAVSTAVALTLPRLGQPMYYFRCFVGKKWRKSRLVFKIINRSSEVLEAHARDNKFPCIGVLLELENAKFAQKLQQPIWPTTKFVYIGKSQRNLDLRVRYFKGARLKKPKI